jgi:hypothetical protein
MGRTPFLLTLFIIILHGACGTPSAESAELRSEEKSKVQTSTKGLELNNGQRWRVSPHMVEPIRRMQVRIGEAKTLPVEQRDNAALADSLFVDMDQLVAACDMKGKAHDMLHEWLMPHMQLAQDLERASDPTLADSLLHALALSSDTYDLYFE